MTGDPFDLSGRTALVTGCRRGIGKAAAIALAAAGADVVGVSASLDTTSDVGVAVEAHGRAFRPYRCDFADRAAVIDAFEGWLRRMADGSTLVVNIGDPGGEAVVDRLRERSRALPPSSIPTTSGIVCSR